jgi:drug/metabolite transporter (DMT)-like permease
MTRMRPFDWLQLICLSVLWGGTFFFGKVAVAEIGPFSLVALRFAIAALALNLICLIRRESGHLDPRHWPSFVAMGLLNNLAPSVLVFWAQQYIESSLAAILTAVNPILTFVLAHFMTHDERITPRRLAGVLLGFSGVLVLFTDSLGSGTGQVLPVLAVLASSLLYSLGAIYGKRFRLRGVAPLQAAAGQFSLGLPIIMAAALIVEQPFGRAMPGPAVWSAVAALGLLSTSLGFILYYRILAAAGACSISLVSFLIPVSATLLGGLVLGERLSLWSFAGLAVIGFGLLLINRGSRVKTE